MAATLSLTDKNFDAVVQKGGTLFIDFWASWCAPCRAFAPIYEAAAKKHPGITFGKIDVEAEEQLGSDFGIQNIPTLVAIRDGVVVVREEGSMPAKILGQIIEAVQGLDMEAVRAELALAEKKAAKKKKPAAAKAKKAAPKKAARPVAPKVKKAPAKKKPAAR